jgi:hypothetical protein
MRSTPSWLVLFVLLLSTGHSLLADTTAETFANYDARYGRYVFNTVEGDYEMRSYSMDDKRLRVVLFKSVPIAELITQRVQPPAEPQALNRTTSEALSFFATHLTRRWSFTAEQVDGLVPFKRTDDETITSETISMGWTSAFCSVTATKGESTAEFKGFVVIPVQGTTINGITAFLDRSIGVENKRDQDRTATPAPQGSVAEKSLNLETSLEDGPSSAAIESLLRDFVAHKASWSVLETTDKRKQQQFNEAYSKGIVSNDVRRAKITNEYTRSIEGETIYVYDFDLEVGMRWHSSVLASVERGVIPDLVRKRSFSAGIVKRGKKWYFGPAPR